MKVAKVVYPGHTDVQTGYLVEGMQDMDLLRKIVNQSEEGILTKFIKSGETANRMDHIVNGFQPIEKAIAKLAIMQSNFDQSNPIYKLGICGEMWLGTLTNNILRLGSAFINQAGGICPFDAIEIVETLEYDETLGVKRNGGYIPKVAKVINLENDFELERKAVDYMSKNYGSNHYAYINNLRLYAPDELERIFVKFIANGGDTVYVYTTGRDSEQMYEYAGAAIRAGIKKFVFDFNSGMDKDINEFVQWLKQRAEVELIK